MRRVLEAEQFVAFTRGRAGSAHGLVTATMPPLKLHRQRPPERRARAMTTVNLSIKYPGIAGIGRKRAVGVIGAAADGQIGRGSSVAAVQLETTGHVPNAVSCCSRDPACVIGRGFVE